MNNIVISNEEDLFNAIEAIESCKETTIPNVKFIDWPRYEITIKGENFNGGIPTRVMQAFGEFQKTIDNAFTRISYRSKRSLTENDRKKTELIVRVKPGSSRFVIDLTESLNHAISKMTGTEIIFVVLGIAAITGGAVIWKAYINHVAKKHELDLKLQMTQEETKRYQSVLNLAEKSVHVQNTLTDMNATRAKFLKSLDVNDQLFLDDTTVVNGEIGRSIPEPSQSVLDLLDEDFIILSVDSGKIRNGFRCKVRSIATKQELTVSILDKTLSSEQIAYLQKWEWKKLPLRMQINIEQLEKIFTKATLVGISPINEYSEK